MDTSRRSGRLSFIADAARMMMRKALLLGGSILLPLSGASLGANEPPVALGGNIVALSVQGRDLARDHNVLAITRNGRSRYRLAAQSIEIVYRRAGQKTADRPDLILNAYAGGAHCCYTVHVISLDGVVADERIPIFDSELELDHSVTPPRLRFYDFTFAYWKAAFAASPAPIVILGWEREEHSYRADIAAMRQPAPDDAALVASAAAMRAKLAAGSRDRPDPALWGRMLDLIYAGNTDAALRFFEAAWPTDWSGKPTFLREFIQQLYGGELWRRYRLGRLLGTDAIFHRIGLMKDRG